MSAATHEPGLKRRVGFWLLTLYGVGVMVGAGVYVLIGEVAGLAGYWTPAAFVLAGLAASATAASFGELSARMPESAGEAAYASEAFGSQAFSVLIGLAVAFVGVISAAAILQGGVGYLRALVDWPEIPTIIGVGMVLGAVAMIGVAESLTVAAVLTLIEVVGLLIVAGAGFLWGGDGVAAAQAEAVTAASDAWPGIVGLGAASFLAFFAFIGFEDMVNMAEETENPRRTMPLAILTAFVIVAALYALVSAAAVYAVEPHLLAESRRPLALVFETATGNSAGFIAAIAVAAALNGVLAQVVMASRVGYGLGRRSVTFAWLHHVHPRFRTPVRATAVAMGIVLVLATVAPLSGLAGASTTLLVIVFLTMNIALIRLKRRGPPPPGAPDVGMLTPVLGIIFSALILVGGLAFSVG